MIPAESQNCVIESDEHDVTIYFEHGGIVTESFDADAVVHFDINGNIVSVTLTSTDKD